MGETDRLAELQRVLDTIGPPAVAVSGGVDSMTLAAVAHHSFGGAMQVFHAISPAVPPRATRRVRDHADRLGWPLHVIDAGEFADGRYRANPVNRCFYCKSSLYGRIAGLSNLPIVSGTNLNDLSDFRPGLKAARDYQVRHPFVEAEIDKPAIRAIARGLGLDDIAELPAAPCLSSRLQTGVTVTADRLAFVDAVETFVVGRLAPQTVRCRIRAHAVEIQLDPVSLEQLQGAAGMRDEIVHFARQWQSMPISFAEYRQGSAVLAAE